MQIYDGRNIRTFYNKHKDIIRSDVDSRLPIHFPQSKFVLDGDETNQYIFKIFPPLTPARVKFVNFLFYKIPIPVIWFADINYTDYAEFEFMRASKERYGSYTIEFMPTRKNIKLLMERFKDISVTENALKIILKKNDEFEKFDNNYERLLFLRKNTENLPKGINKDFEGFSKEFEPFPHQRVTIEYLNTFDKFLVLHEQGTGKTYCCIALINDLIKKNKIEKALIICPKNISHSVWEEQISKFSNLTTTVIDGTAKVRKNKLNDNSNIFIIGYEAVYSLLDDFQNHFMTRDTLIICDEATKIKNPSAKRSKSIHKLGKLSDRKIALTGTPCTQSPADIFSLMLFVDSGETFGPSFPSFASEYFYESRYSATAEPKTGAIQMISDLMYKKAIRYEKSEVLKFLPPKIYERVDVAMTPEQELIYKQMKELFIVMLDGGASKAEATVIITQMLRLSQITGGFIKTVGLETKRFEKNPKLSETVEIVESAMDNNESIVIWCRFVAEIKMVHNALKNKNIDSVYYFGKVNQDKKDKSVKDFQAGRVKVFIGQAQSGGMGLDLWKACKVIFYSNLYSYAERVQAEDRCHRFGSQEHSSVIYYDLAACHGDGKPTIDHAILSILLQKKSVADIVVANSNLLRNI